MRRFFNLLLGALAMIAVALLSAFVTMRLAIHGREVEIPNVAGLTVAEARSLASNLGLNVLLENQFYSTVTPAGRVLAQSPAPGTKVRREWVLRVTESIGPQKVSVPNVVGETEREASATIRRLSLELGTVAYIPAQGASGIVVSQTPTPAAAGIDGPRISLLVSEPIPVVRARPTPADPSVEAASSADSDSAAPPNGTQGGTETAPQTGLQSGTAPTPAAPISAPAAAPVTEAQTDPEAYVMPNLMGLTLAAATARVQAMGLHIASMETVAARVGAIGSVGATAPPGKDGQPTPMKPVAPIATITLANTVISQSPSPGRRVTKSQSIRITVTR